MNLLKAPHKALEDNPPNVKIKLAALWASFMFLYIYVDYFALYKTGYIADVMVGKVWDFQITQGFLLGALVSVSVPALMIFLCVALPAWISRWANILIATLYIPYSLFNLAGELLLFMIFGAAVEVVLLLLVIRNAWQWPEHSAPVN